MSVESLEIIYERMQRIANPYGGIFREIEERQKFVDDPSYYLFCVKLPDFKALGLNLQYRDIAGGAFFDKKKAFMKAVGEAVERYCLCVPQRRKMIFNKKASEIKNAINPKVFDVLLPEQREEFIKKYGNHFKLEENSVFNWHEAFDIINNRKVWIPAQLVYVIYPWFENEPFLQIPISTGAACGSNFYHALYAAICEVVERDSFMIHWLAKLPPVELELKESWFTKLKRMFERYDLELRVYSIETDLKIPAFMALILDDSENGYPVHLGLKAGFDGKETILSAIAEALQFRVFARVTTFQQKLQAPKPEEIRTFEERLAFWLANRKKIRKWLSFILETDKKQRKIKKYPCKTFEEKVNLLKTLLKKAKCNVYVADITLPDVREEGFRVVKAVIPELQPLWLNERFPYLGVKRLRKFVEIEKINKIPHLI